MLAAREAHKNGPTRWTPRLLGVPHRANLCAFVRQGLPRLRSPADPPAARGRTGHHSGSRGRQAGHSRTTAAWTARGPPGRSMGVATWTGTAAIASRECALNRGPVRLGCLRGCHLVPFLAISTHRPDHRNGEGRRGLPTSQAGTIADRVRLDRWDSSGFVASSPGGLAMQPPRAAPPPGEVEGFALPRFGSTTGVRGVSRTRSRPAVRPGRRRGTTLPFSSVRSGLPRMPTSSTPVDLIGGSVGGHWGELPPARHFRRPAFPSSFARRRSPDTRPPFARRSRIAAPSRIHRLASAVGGRSASM